MRDPGPDQRERTTARPADSSSRADADAVALLVEEARLEHDRAMMRLETVDDRAMRSVRTALLVVGFVASAIGIAGPEAVASVSTGVVLWLTLGVTALLAATLRGIDVYRVSAPPEPGHPSLEAVSRTGMTYSDTARRSIDRRETMTRTIDDRINTRVVGLNRVLSCLRVGIGSLSVAAGAFVLSTGYGVGGSVAAMVVGLAGVLVAVAGRR